MFNHRKGSLRRFDIRLGAAVALILLCFSSSALANGSDHARHSRPVSTPYRVTPAQRLTLQLTQIESWAAHHRLGAAQRHRLIALSKARAHAVATLAAQDPDLALRWLLTPHQRLVLRRIRGTAVEQRVALSGRYRLLTDGDSSFSQLVSGDGKHVWTLRTVELPPLAPDALLSVSGFRFGDTLLVPRAGVRVLSLGAAATASSTVGTINTAVIVATFTDSGTTVDVQKIRNVFQGNPGHDVDSYFSEASYGKMTLAPSFYGPLVLPETTAAGCSSNTLQQDIINAAGASLNLTSVRRLILVANCPRVFGYSSTEGPISTPGGTITAATTLLDPTSAYSTYFLAHEISHTLGSGDKHASFYVCLPAEFIAPTRFDQGCADDEYGDPFDVLGGGPARLVAQQDPYHKANAGWFTSANYPTVTTPGTTTYTLSPYELPSDGPLALNIPRGNSGTYFTVEYRQPVGFDSWMGSSSMCPNCTVTNGASIRVMGVSLPGGGGGGDTALIDTTPGSIPSAYFYPLDDARDAALTPGNTFTDPEYGISVKTLSVDASGLKVQVTVPPQTCTHASPTVSAVSPASQAVRYGQTATYAFTLTNNDSAGCPANTFQYSSPGTEGLNIVATPDFVTLAPGASTTISLAISAASATTVGTWAFTSMDGRGGGYISSNSLGTSAAVTSGFSFTLTTPADSSAPSAPAGLSARALGAGAVKLSWQPSSDNAGAVGYSIVSSNGYSYTTTGTTFVDPDAQPSTSYTYTVKAYDRAGNYSAAATASAPTTARTDFTGPTPPTVTATATDHSVNVSWTSSTDNRGVAYYRISPCLVPNCVVPADVHSFSAGGLPTRTQLNLQITAVDGDGNASDRSSGRYSVYTAAQGTNPPSQPLRLVSTAGTYHSVSLSWSPSTDDNGVAGYYVFRNSRQIATVSGTTYTDTDVAASAEYAVQAFDANGSLSAPSLELWFKSPASPSSDTSPPTTTIAAPTDGATVAGTVNVSVSAADDVDVTSAELYVDGVLQTTASGPGPYTFSWDTTTASEGPHWLYVLAYDAARNYGTTGGVMVDVNNSGSDSSPPTVSVTAPASGATVSGSVPVSATASDNVGVTRVDFAVDGTVVASAGSAPYGFTWNATGASAGSHTITATAYDAAGNSTPTSVDVTVPSAADTTTPTVSFASPASGATVSGTASVQANASDNIGVTSVTLSVDGSVVGTDTSSPWTFSIDTTLLANGTHTLAVQASDGAGNASSAQESVTAQNSLPNLTGDTKAPSTPSNPKLAVAGTTQAALYWSPSSDNVGVAGYNVFRDGVLIAQTTVPDYFDTGLAPGTSHVYSLRAFDAAGNVSSASRTTTVKTVALSTATTGTLAGVVFSSIGKPVANVVVTLTGNGLTKTAKTSTAGVYKFTSLPAGTYTITFGTTAAAAATSGTEVTTVGGQTVVVVTSS